MGFIVLCSILFAVLIAINCKAVTLFNWAVLLAVLMLCFK